MTPQGAPDRAIVVCFVHDTRHINIKKSNHIDKIQLIKRQMLVFTNQGKDKFSHEIHVSESESKRYQKHFIIFDDEVKIRISLLCKILKFCDFKGGSLEFREIFSSIFSRNSNFSQNKS